MEIHTKENLRKEEKMDMVFALIKMEINLKEIGKMENMIKLVLKYLPMEIHMRENLILIIYSKVKVYINMQMDQNMMEHGNKEKKMEKEYTHLQMDRYLMLDILKMNSKIVRHLLMLAEKNMLVNGKMICIMEKVLNHGLF